MGGHVAETVQEAPPAVGVDDEVATQLDAIKFTLPVEITDTHALREHVRSLPWSESPIVDCYSHDGKEVHLEIVVGKRTYARVYVAS